MQPLKIGLSKYVVFASRVGQRLRVFEFVKVKFSFEFAFLTIMSGFVNM